MNVGNSGFTVGTAWLPGSEDGTSFPSEVGGAESSMLRTSSEWATTATKPRPAGVTARRFKHRSGS